MGKSILDILKHFGKTPHKFRDPIYGFIELNEAELKIIDTPLFQRLRRIHQLALTKYVYPTAEHSRFTHSLGVLQSATNIFLNIYRNSDKNIFSSDMEEAANKLQILRFAALLHDIGHLPFSHATEKVILKNEIGHEQLGKFIIEKYSPIKDVIKKKGINPPNIVGNLLTDAPLPTEYLILKNIISGQLDADRADYLLRDSYVCGVKYGEYDYNRYIQSFFLKQNKDGIIQLCVEEKNIYLVESFLLARYHYNLQVPYHRTRVGYDIILKKYIESLKERENLPIIITYDENGNILKLNEELFELFDDYNIFEKIKIDSKKDNIWAKMLMRQGHIIPIFDHIKTQDNEHIYKDILYKLKKDSLKENKNFFRYEKELNVSNLLQQTENLNENTGYTLGLIVNNREKPENILNYSNILNQLVRPIEILRIYVLKEHLEKAQKICKESHIYFEELNEA